jgi:DNA-binding LacI/PurR family transcriptional regulator
MTDVARHAGVSQAAVSFVLGGGKYSRRVSEKTALRIREVAKQLNFHPNHAAQQLSGKRSGVIGVLGSNWSGDQLPTRVLVWLTREAAERGIVILAEETVGNAESLERYASKCLSWNVDGLLFLAYNNDAIWPAAAAALGQLPRVVSVMGDAGIPNSHTVETDLSDGVHQAIRHLYEGGRRRIVLILEALDYQINCRRKEAFFAAHAELGLPCDDSQVCLATRGWKESDTPRWEALRDDLVDVRRADAILADSDATAAGLVSACKQRGVRVPEDLALVGWGNSTIARWIDPKLSSVDFLPAQLMGRSLDLLAGLIDQPHGERPRTIHVKPELIVRASG